MEKPKPCPFCGGEATIKSRIETYDNNYKPVTLWAIGCNTNGCHGAIDVEEGYYESESVAIESWNVRSKKVDDKTVKEIIIDKPVDVPEVGIKFPKTDVFNVIIYQTVKILEQKGCINNIPAVNIWFISQLRSEVIGNIHSGANLCEYYTINEIAEKWGLSKSQTHVRLKLLEKAGRIRLRENMGKQIIVEKWGFDAINSNMLSASVLLPILQKVFNTKPATSMEKLRYAMRRGKIESEQIGKKYFPNPKSFLLWLCKKCKRQLK